MIAAALLCLLYAADAKILSQQAVEAAQRKDFTSAERLWKQALVLSPGLYDANYNLGYMYNSHGQFAQAEPLLRKAVAVQPKDFNARYLLGAVLSKLDRVDDALRQWHVALTLQPGNLRLRQILSIEYAKGRYFRQAAEIADKALAIKQDDASLWLTAIRAHQDADEHPAALRLAEKMAAAFPANARAAFELGYELTRGGRTDEGLPWLRKAMQSPQPWEEPFYFYGDSMLKAGQYQQAIEAFQKALELRKEYMPAWAGLGRALMSAGEWNRAVEALQKAADVDPTHPQPHLLLSQVYFRMGEEQRAAQEKETAARLRKNRPETLESIPGRTLGP